MVAVKNPQSALILSTAKSNGIFYATEHLPEGGNPLVIAAALGQRDAQMLLQRYAKFKDKYAGVGVRMDDHAQRNYEE